MKIDRELQDVTFEVLDHKFAFSKNDTPQIVFKLNIVGQIFDPVYFNLSLDDKAFKYTLSNIHYMTGLFLESIFEIDPESPNYKRIIGKKFVGNIIKNGNYFNVQLLNASKTITKKFLSELDTKYKRTMLEYAAEKRASSTIEDLIQ